MLKKELILITIDDSNLLKDLNYLADHAFIHPSNLTGEIPAHYLRPIIKITNTEKNKSIIRKVRARSFEGLGDNNIALDFLNRKELAAKKGDKLIISKPNLLETYIIYPLKHPDYNIRIAFIYFIASIVVSVLIAKIIS
jgi:hypothetical protein